MALAIVQHSVTRAGVGLLLYGARALAGSADVSYAVVLTMRRPAVAMRLEPAVVRSAVWR